MTKIISPRELAKHISGTTSCPLLSFIYPRIELYLSMIHFRVIVQNCSIVFTVTSLHAVVFDSQNACFIFLGFILVSTDGVLSENDELTGLSDAFIDADDHKDAVHNVARCLKIVADKIVDEKRRTGRFCFCFFSIYTICFTESLYKM